QAENPNVAITETSNRASVSAAEDDVQNARAELSAAKHDLDQAEAQDRLAQLQLQRGKQLLASNTISQADYDQRLSAAEAARAHGQAVGHRQLPRDADPAHEAGPEGGRARRRHRPRLQRHGRELRGRDRLALQPAAPRERERQLREGRAAPPRAHLARSRAARARAAPP